MYKTTKKFIKKEIQRVLSFIKYKHSQIGDKSLKQLQNEIVDVIENIRDQRDGTGYVFIYTFDGINIADPILKENAGKNLINFQDPNGKLVIKELIDISKNIDGGYVNYVWNKPTTNKLSPKVSYAISYKPWNWMIGSGVYLDDIDTVLQKKKDDYYKKISQYLFQTLLLILILFIIGTLVYKYLMSIIQDDIGLIKKASKELEHINTKDISFKEFKQVAYHINNMNDELKDLNKNLEDKVELRTKELEVSKQYALDLVEQQDKFIKDSIHEINTPLSIIITNIDLFKIKYPVNKYLSKIEAGSKIIHNIYNDLEFMVKKDRINYISQDIELSTFIKDRIEFFKQIAIGNNLLFNLKLEENIDISFNPTLLQRVCDNTLSNAIKYSYENTTIDINLYTQKDTIVFEVINRGDTIKDTTKLFDRFYRENNSRGGFGIGLNIIKEICDKNKVKMEVKSADEVTKFIYEFEKEK
ncbi:MAG: cache domain-containing protein [Campylobacterota bacterium]|nr:cache domain-containing protein [Campylobacterota bacterium]